MSDSTIPPADHSTTAVFVPVAAPPALSKGKQSAEKTTRISERAHQISEQRGADGGGNPESDWLEAEREIDTATKGYQR